MKPGTKIDTGRGGKGGRTGTGESQSAFHSWRKAPLSRTELCVCGDHGNGGGIDRRIQSEARMEDLLQVPEMQRSRVGRESQGLLRRVRWWMLELLGEQAGRMFGGDSQQTKSKHFSY